MRLPLPVFALLLLAGSRTAISTDPPNTTPVDTSLLSGGALRLADGNCLIPAPPGTGWRWLQTEISGLPVYLCVNEALPDVLSVSAHSYAATKVSQAFVRGFLRGVERSAKKQNRKFRSLGPLPAPSPDSRAAGFSFSLETPDGDFQYSYGYVIPTGRLTVIQAFSGTTTPPAWLASVANRVTSITPLALEETFPIVRITSWPVPHVILAGLAWGAITLFNRARHRRLNPWTAVLIVLALSATIDVFLLLRSGVFEDMLDNQPAEALGMVTGVPLLVGIATLWLRHRHARKERMETAAA